MTAWKADFFVADWLVSQKLSRISRDGETIGLKHKSMAVLVCLADADGQVLSRNEIMDSVWPGMEVTDDVLTQSVVELRKAFTDDARSPRFIETIPKVGFRLIAPVTAAESASPGRNRRKHGLIAAGVLIAAFVYLSTIMLDGTGEQREETGSSGQAIAVLPFVNMSGDPDQEYFSDGLSEEILNLLTGIPDLKVVGRTSSFAFKGKNEDLRKIGRALGVTTVIEGSVRRSGDRIRVTAQLIDVSDGTHIWSETYDRTVSDIFEIQDDVAASIIGALEIHIGSRPMRGRPTEDPEAYSQYLRALASVNALRYSEAETHLTQVLALDPQFGEAHELRAYNFFTQSTFDMPVEQARELARESAEEALAIDPDLSLAGFLHRVTSRRERTRLNYIQEVDRQEREQPYSTMILDQKVYHLMLYGYPQQALATAQRFLDFDPLSPIANFRIYEVQYALGQKREAYGTLELARQLGTRGGDWRLGELYLIDREDDKALEHFEASLASFDRDPAWIRELVTSARGPDASPELLGRQIAAFVDGMAPNHAFTWQSVLNNLYLVFGHVDEFYDLLFGSNPEVSWDAAHLFYIGTMYRHTGFTADPRYVEAARALKITDLWEVRGPPDFCQKSGEEWVCE